MKKHSGDTLIRADDVCSKYKIAKQTANGNIAADNKFQLKRIQFVNRENLETILQCAKKPTFV